MLVQCEHGAKGVEADEAEGLCQFHKWSVICWIVRNILITHRLNCVFRRRLSIEVHRDVYYFASCAERHFVNWLRCSWTTDTSFCADDDGVYVHDMVCYEKAGALGMLLRGDNRFDVEVDHESFEIVAESVNLMFNVGTVFGNMLVDSVNHFGSHGCIADPENCYGDLYH